jgi:hypothetical protein
MVGHSLSFCILDILKGEVQVSDVEYIECGFREPKNYAAFREQSIKRYLKYYWRSNRRRAKRIARRLYKSGKLRFTGFRHLEQNWT